MGDNMDMTRMSRNEDQVHRTRNTPRPRKERRDGWYSRWDRGAGRRGVKPKAQQTWAGLACYRDYRERSAKIWSGVDMERSLERDVCILLASFVAVPKGGRTGTAFYRRG